jgi:hypothetical protein
MNSNFIQRDGGRLYNTANMGQQEYGVELVLNRSKPSVTNLKLLLCDFCHHLLTVLGHNFDEP